MNGFDRILWVAAAIALAGAILTVALLRGGDFEPTADEKMIVKPCDLAGAGVREGK